MVGRKIPDETLTWWLEGKPASSSPFGKNQEVDGATNVCAANVSGRSSLSHGHGHCCSIGGEVDEGWRWGDWRRSRLDLTVMCDVSQMGVGGGFVPIHGGTWGNRSGHLFAHDPADEQRRSLSSGMFARGRLWRRRE